ncbi:hypothetical protein [Bosea sp. NPDC055594]
MSRRRKNESVLLDPGAAINRAAGKAFKKWLKGPTKAEQKNRDDLERVKNYLERHGLKSNLAKGILEEAKRSGVRLNQIEKQIIIPRYVPSPPVEERPTQRPRLPVEVRDDETSTIEASGLESRVISKAQRRASTSIFRQIGTAILRGILGSMSGGRKF